MNARDQIEEVLKGVRIRQAETVALFVIELHAGGGGTLSIAPCDVGTPEQLHRVHAAMSELRDAISVVVRGDVGAA